MRGRGRRSPRGALGEVAFRLTLLGVGAMDSPRYAPAGLLVDRDGTRVMLDGGAGAVPDPPLDAWVVTDERAELIREIRRLADERSVEPPAIRSFSRRGLRIRPRRVVHTSHETCGYLIEADGRRIAWAPEFFEFPGWARGVDLLFADGSSWSRPIYFAGGVGGHAALLDVAEEARRRKVRRLVFAHIGRPTIRAMDRGSEPPFGAFGYDGMVVEPRRWRS